MNYRKIKGGKWFYVPEICYDEAQKIHDTLTKENIEYIMEWSAPSKSRRILTVELNPDDLKRAFYLIESFHLGFSKSVECNYEKSEIILEY